MIMLLSDAQDNMKKMQSLFHLVFDGYVDAIEIKQLDERENQQMLCLTAVYNWLIQNKPYVSSRQLLKQIKPKKLADCKTFDINDNASQNKSVSIADAIENLELLRNIQLNNIYNRCPHLDDLSTQIVDKYLKRYNDAIENMRRSYQL